MPATQQGEAITPPLEERDHTPPTHPNRAGASAGSGTPPPAPPGTGRNTATAVPANGENPPNEIAVNLKDGDVNTKWLSFTSTGWAAYQLSSPVAVQRYQLASANDAVGRDPQDWQFQGSNDGKNWTTLDTQSGETFPARFYEMEYALPKPAAYRYYRLNVTANSGAPGLQIADIKLLSRQPIPNAPVSALIHWRANDSADREREIAGQKAEHAQ